MKSRRGAVVVVGAAIAASCAMIVSCALEGDVFTLLPDASPPADSSTFDSSADTHDGAPDSFDDFETDLDAAFTHCRPDVACDRRFEQCCIWASLDGYCTEAGACPDGGEFECDRASQCDAGSICCAAPAAFSTFGKCEHGPCTNFQYCESNAECPSGRCTLTGTWGTCKSP